MDALYGCVPDIFPFGAHSAWTGNGVGMETYRIKFEDHDVQIVLELAKKVAALHKEIGKLEMTDFEFLTADGYVQKTTFEDGTEVYANFSPYIVYYEHTGTIKPESWVVVRK